MRSTFLALGTNPIDQAVVRATVAELGGTVICNVRDALHLIRNAELSAVIVGTDVGDLDAIRLIGLLRAVQPRMPVICIGERSMHVQLHTDRTVPRALLAAALCTVILDRYRAWRRDPERPRSAA
jgi:hypothetical protein